MNTTSNMFSLDGKVAIITGGSGLYGRQIVLSLAQAGAKVYIASRNLNANEIYAQDLRKQGFLAYAETVDQSDEKSIMEFAKRMSDKEQKIDILVNNSVLRTMKSFEDTAKNFEESLRVNGTGLFIITRELGNIMAKKGGGSIINVGSYMGSLGADDTLYKDVDFTAYNSPDYFFHKGGMTNLTRLIASYYGPKNVRCNIIQLGGLYSGQDEKFVNRYNERTFLKRMANETDIMGIVVFLASDASAYITGAAIPVDGGYSAK